mmetsp:Transcript_2709/g.5806  ORF Transcript_2709/g.5806 Transcript_2709/m.5806 type:complete len:323 (+) Transcript_2709:1102-2070(+)
MERHLVDAPCVPRKVVELLARGHVPDVDHVIRRARADHFPVRAPAALEKVLLHVVLSSEELLRETRLVHERPHVPLDQRLVHRVGEQRRAVRTDSHACDCVLVPLKHEDDTLVPPIPRFDLVVDPRREDELVVVREACGRDLVLGLELLFDAPAAHVPHLRRAVVAAAHDQAAFAQPNGVDDARVLRERTRTPADVHIPHADALVGRRRDDLGAVAVPAEVEHDILVPCENVEVAVVLPVYFPQEDAFVMRAARHVLARRVELARVHRRLVSTEQHSRRGQLRAPVHVGADLAASYLVVLLDPGPLCRWQYERHGGGDSTLL